MFSLGAFIASPTIEALSSVTCDELVLIAGHYKVEVRGSPAKADLLSKHIEVLTAQGVFGDGGKVPDEVPKPGSPVSPGRSTTPPISKKEVKIRWLK